MNEYGEPIEIDAILPDLRAAERKQAFQTLCEAASRLTGLDAKDLLSRLLEGERGNVSYGIGGGVAIPHLMLETLEKPCHIFARLPRPIAYDSVDGGPVDLVFLILSPASDGPYHLQRLARVSRLLRDRALCARLRGADSADVLHAIMFDMTGSRIAA